MKLLIVTQKVDINDDNLGFFHCWLEKFSEKLEKLYVICLWEGRHNLPDNVQVYSLGKEKGYSKMRQFFLLQKFLFKILRDADGVFVHMCPIYAILSFPLAKLFRKKTLLWYLHKSVNWKLKLAGKLTDKILTASSESCRLKNRNKIEIVGHGIDIDKFQTTNYKLQTTNYKILCVGRISLIKDQETLIEAVDILINQKDIKNLELKIIGSPLENYEKEYYKKIKNLVKDKNLENYVEFSGSIFHKEMPQYYQNNDVLINLCPTGGIDKVVLEAMACKMPVLLCNRAFEKDLAEYKDILFFQEKNSQNLAQKILGLKNLNNKIKIELGNYLRNQIVQNHDLDNLVKKIVNEFKK